MPLDGITARYLAEELHTQLNGSRVDRVYQEIPTDVMLSLRNQGKNYKLVLSIRPESPRIHITMRSSANPAVPPMFCMLLRKHLLGARLVSVQCDDWERVFRLEFQNANEMGDETHKTLIVEIMGRHSNIILVSENGTILDAANHVDHAMSRVREVLPARRYTPPPSQDKVDPWSVLEILHAGDPAFSERLSTARNVELALLDMIRGFSPPLCREICHLADIDGKRHASTLSTVETRRVATQTTMLLERILTGPAIPTLFRLSPDTQNWTDFHAFPLESCGFRVPLPTLSDAMDTYYTHHITKNRLEQRRRALAQAVSTRLDRVLRKAEAHRADIKSCEGLQDMRRDGELILANMYALKDGIPGFEAIDYANEGQPLWITLDSSRTLSQNAQRLFKAYTKRKSRLEASTRFLAQDMEQSAYLASLLTAIENAQEDGDLEALSTEWSGFTASEDLRESGASGDKANQKPRGKKGTGKGSKKKPGTREPARQPAGSDPRRYRSSDGFDILVGRNNIQNDRLTFKTADRDDIWLHVQKEPGTHVIIRAGRREVPERTLLEAAQIAAWFSRPGKKEAQHPLQGDGAMVSVDYCPVSHVKKMSGARPGMVLYENHRSVRVRPQDPSALGAHPESDS